MRDFIYENIRGLIAICILTGMVLYVGIFYETDEIPMGESDYMGWVFGAEKNFPEIRKSLDSPKGYCYSGKFENGKLVFGKIVLPDGKTFFYKKLAPMKVKGRRAVASLD